MKKIVVGITGASGSVYGKRLIEVLAEKGFKLSVIATDKGKQVFNYELSLEIDSFVKELNEKYKNIKLEDNNNLFAGVASGSHGFDAVIIVPCSMGTLAEISYGLSRNLLSRAADVALKENKKLILVPRETPLNTIHLENMYRLSKVGATIIPAMPGFYNHPESIDDLVNFQVGKILNYLNIDNNLFERWEDKTNEI
ncbi:UbiX family flavin prenyltransferase [Clostridium celatum]|uniref:Flavin prenyltransferase UbiX n=1 Tax=Clostridium celatum DSM 1785 TaxID=545697 RepID=L1Q5K4_9CLOT|nr:flavin prenyltransferase UbiX [Clostridium celatum]EKY23253.1 polyprenyl P-hydroxybenzoate and phenylacrylic acid decarboxylase [Clostridium celatum DSM 1785]MCE9655998.1 UbiX family flavin prenyltransferase [Clostridium celatum]MDU2264894.1 flavin prenyltransferase UbiX [Clostridium celatum]MDU3722131.1 flavin prenyltransferase UbiX [Clostridium celatum]MDU6294488.1 flavin prenyltransferase UbiX [Clostridium celatum]